MSTLQGALLGAMAGLGLVLVGAVLVMRGRTTLESRVGPWLRGSSSETALVRSSGAVPVRGGAGASGPGAAAAGIAAPLLQRAADAVEAVLGGGASVRRRLERAGEPDDVHGFRVEQVQWGLVGFAVAVAWQTLGLLAGRGGLLSSLVVCAGAFACGVILRDRRLTQAADARDRAVLAEFPVIAELLALAVASGEGPVAALDRVVRRSHGALSDELARVLAQTRTGTPVARAFEAMAERSALPVVSQFAQGVAVSMDRGTPLADVLHAQAADVREAGRRGLIESAARREIYMLAPVVFLVLPVTVLFAFLPGVVGLRLVAP
ncbi:type II secretion system F family protein [Nocardioides yefusunii]|uniref:Type II secretion system F family protein n=1 Tax=Nocardioides yefusunii TaxID=2500546 RepID=A0ABW1QVK6_9ACTN|nr:type II secretion system F family protein [Nocardioides yefusunii]